MVNKMTEQKVKIQNEITGKNIRKYGVVKCGKIYVNNNVCNEHCTRNTICQRCE